MFECNLYALDYEKPLEIKNLTIKALKKIGEIIINFDSQMKTTFAATALIVFASAAE